MTRNGKTRLSCVGHVVLALMLAVSGLVAVTGQTSRARDLFAQAMHQEDAAGNPTVALELYQQVLAAGPDRALAARAQLRIGICHERLGNQAAAAAAFAKVVSGYADQPAVLAEARARAARGLAPQPAPVAASLQAVQIYSGNDLDPRASPSPDGRHLAIVDYSTEGDVGVMDLTTGSRRMLTRDADYRTGFAHHPVFSPDGNQIAYAWSGDRDVALRVVDRSGGAPRTLIARPIAIDYPVAWSPDGRRLALNLYGDGQSRIAVATIANGSIAPGAIRPLKSTGWQKADVGGFSPDGRFLVYSLVPSDSQRGGVFIIAVDGSGEAKVADGRSPAWTPDGRSVVFVSDRSGTSDLWSVSIADGKPTSAPPERLKSNIGDISNLGFARDGTFFYGTRTLGRDIVTASLDSAVRRVGAPVPLTQTLVGSNSGAAWSPDGRRMAFFRGGDMIVVRTIATGEERVVPTKLQRAVVLEGIRWFPDGRAVLVQDATGNGRRGYKKVETETGAQQVLFDAPIGTAFAPFDLSPDGRFVYYFRRGEEEAGGVREITLVRRDLQTGIESDLHRNKASEGAVRLAASPDSSRIAFKPAGETVILSMPAAGGATTDVRRGDSLTELLAWTRDGRFLIAARNEATGNDTRERLYLLPVEGGTPVALDHVARGSIDRLSVSAADNTLVMSVSNQNKELWVVRNLLRQASAR